MDCIIVLLEEKFVCLQFSRKHLVMDNAQGQNKFKKRDISSIKTNWLSFAVVKLKVYFEL